MTLEEKIRNFKIEQEHYIEMLEKNQELRNQRLHLSRPAPAETTLTVTVVKMTIKF